jgi:phosphatidylglycerophosphatase A
MLLVQELESFCRARLMDVPEGVRNGQHPRALPDRLILILATGFGLGYLPIVPGTFGSLAGLPLAWGVHFLPVWGQILAAVLCFLIGVPVCDRGARLMGSKDPGAVVFDEIAAFAVLFIGTGLGLVSGAVGFVLFRVLDVLKPWPARRLEHLPGGWGIMADDCAAAIYAAGLLWFIHKTFGLW